MKDLLRSYRETKRQTIKSKESFQKKLAELEVKNKNEPEIGIQSEISMLRHDIEIYNAAISDATFAIKWISTGTMPNASRGIERQSKHKREIAFEDKWMDAFVDNGVEFYKLPGPDEEVEKMKVELVNDLKECLTPRQLEIFVMLAEGLEQVEIAQMLDVSSQAVSEVIIRGRQRIKDAGWIFA